uniref:FGGY_N domain-containing protein n=1 Tax=Macrostomum lignano TaxID=282301 RepID=A0A1I8HMX7_9PLAT
MKEPIELKSIVTERRLLKYPEVFGSLDRGCSLTKVLYVKPVPEKPEKVSLEMAVYANSDFEHVLDWLVARATEEGVIKTAGRKLRVTGVGGEKFKNEIAATTCMGIEFVDEIMSHQTGGHFLLNNYEDDVFCYADGRTAEESKPPVELPPWIAALQSRIDEIFTSADGHRLPVIFGFCGSGTVINKLNEDGTADMLGVHWFGGKSFLACRTCYWAQTTMMRSWSWLPEAKEMIDQDAKAEYRMLPGDFPMFPFGKSSEGAIPTGSFRREDVAAAVVGCIVSGLLTQVAAYCKLHRIRRVYLGGNFFRAKVARDILRDCAETVPTYRPLRFHFMSNGHTGCLGALQASAADAAEMRAKLSSMKVDEK